MSHGYKSTGANLLEEIGILLTFYSLGLVNIYYVLWTLQYQMFQKCTIYCHLYNRQIAAVDNVN